MSVLTDSAFWLFAATLGLVVVTAYYAIQTRRTVIEMRKATEAQFLPALKISVTAIGPVNIDMVVTNVGKGAALEVNAKFCIRELKNSERYWTCPMLVPEGSERLAIPVGPEAYESSMDFFKATQSTLEFQAEYHDIFGKLHSVSHLLDVTAQVKQFERTRVRYSEDELAQIRRELEKIARWLQQRRAP